MRGGRFRLDDYEDAVAYEALAAEAAVAAHSVGLNWTEDKPWIKVHPHYGPVTPPC